jgi:hypothetical protein
MSIVYKKEITTTHLIDFVRCDKCGIETQFCLAIDMWCTHNDESYCHTCQKKHKVGWFEPKNKKRKK